MLIIKRLPDYGFVPHIFVKLEKIEKNVLGIFGH